MEKENKVYNVSPHSLESGGGYVDKYMIELKNKFGLNSPKEGRLFRIGILLLKLCVVIISMLWLNSVYGINSINNILEIFDYRFILAMLIAYLIARVFDVLSDYIYLFYKTKSRSIVKPLKGDSVRKYFSLSYLKESSAEVMQFGNLTKCGVAGNYAIDVVNLKSFYNKFSWTIISVLGFVCGIWFAQNTSWVYVLVLVIFGVYLLTNTFDLILTWLYYCKKDRGIGITLKLCQLKNKLIKSSDFDKESESRISKKLSLIKSLKCSGKLVIIGIVLNVLKFVLLSLISYIAVSSLNEVGVTSYFVSLYLFVLCLSLYKFLPFRGVGLIEIIIIALFKELVMVDYVFYIVLIFELFTIFMPVCEYLLSRTYKLKRK